MLYASRFEVIYSRCNLVQLARVVLKVLDKWGWFNAHSWVGIVLIMTALEARNKVREKWIVCGFGVKSTNVCVCGSSRVVGGSFMRFWSILYNCACVLFFFLLLKVWWFQQGTKWGNKNAFPSKWIRRKES